MVPCVPNAGDPASNLGQGTRLDTAKETKAQRCCHSFPRTAKGLSHTCICIHAPQTPTPSGLAALLGRLAQGLTCLSFIRNRGNASLLMNREGESLSTLTVSDEQTPPALLSLPQIPVLRITKTSASNSPAKEEDAGEGLDSRHGAEEEERLVLCEPASSLQGATSHPSSRKL